MEEKTIVKPEEIVEEQPKTGFLEKLKTHKIKILGGVLGVLVFVGAVFGAYKLGQRQVQPGPQPTPTPGLVATPTPDPTAKWKTYTNTKYGYSIKYPEDMFHLEREAKLPRLSSVEFTKKEGPAIGEIPGVELTVYEDEGLSLEVWFDKRSTTEPFEVSESSTIFYYKVTEKQEISFNGSKGIRFVDNQITGAPIPTVIVSNQNLVVSIRGYYFVHDESLQETFNLMLSTFKFLEESAYKCVEESSLNCAEEIELSFQCTEEYQTWARENCSGWKKFVCPKNNTIDCMPIIQGEKEWLCSKEYLDWAKENCPEFTIAY